jgi:hypothetical protein
MSLLGWIIALVGFVGIVLTLTPLGLAFLPEEFQWPVGAWGALCMLGLLVAMFTRRARN